MFIVEAATKTGRISEAFATYEEARRRVDAIPAETLTGIPFIFQELPDGSERLVREDGKPLQWHRLPENALSGSDESLPLCDDSSALLGEGHWTLLPNPTPQDDDGDDYPL
jgi:hypothetical protein